MSRVIADGLSGKVTATTQEAEDATAGKYPDAAGVHAAFNQYGLGRNGSEDIGDLDDAIKVTGIYVVSPTTAGTLPNGASDNAMVLAISRTGGGGTAQLEQTFYDNVNRRVWLRTARSGSFTAWREVFQEGNVATTAEAEAGTADDKPMTPLKTHEAFNRYGLGVGGYNDGVSSLADLTTGNVCQFIDPAGQGGLGSFGGFRPFLVVSSGGRGFALQALNSDIFVYTSDGIEMEVLHSQNSNAFTDADESKLDGIEAGATADQTAGEIKTAYESNADTNAFTDADESAVAALGSNANRDVFIQTTDPGPGDGANGDIALVYDA